MLVDGGDVLREAAMTQPGKHRGTLSRPSGGPSPIASEGELRDRVALLEEIVRRQRIVSECEDEIAERYREISRQRREIEELLLAPSWVPEA